MHHILGQRALQFTGLTRLFLTLAAVLEVLATQTIFLVCPRFGEAHEVSFSHRHH
jgi:hypothetical protein